MYTSNFAMKHTIHSILYNLLASIFLFLKGVDFHKYTYLDCNQLFFNDFTRNLDVLNSGKSLLFRPAERK